jgi:HK97 gp10 family phage protein
MEGSSGPQGGVSVVAPMKVRNRSKMDKRFRDFGGPPIDRAINAALFEAADEVRAEAQRSITAGSVSGKNHVASKPGEPPHNDTSVLRNNIETSQPRPFVARVSSEAPYAADLEFGTSKMAERPYMRPARDKVKPRAARILRLRIRQAKEKFT